MPRHSHYTFSNRRSSLTSTKLLINGLVTLLLTGGVGLWVWYTHGEKSVEGEWGQGKIRYGGRVAATQSLLAVDSGLGGGFKFNSDVPVQAAPGDQPKSGDDILPATMGSCHDQVEALQLTVTKLQSTNTQLLTDISAEQVKHRKEVTALRKEIAQLFGELTNGQETNQELLDRIGELEGLLEDASRIAVDFSSENDKLKGKVDALTGQVSMLQDQLAQATLNADSALQAQLNDALQENSTLESQVNSLNAQVSILQTQLSGATTDPALLAQLQGVTLENALLKLQLASLNNQVTSLQSQVTDLTAQNMSLQSQIQQAMVNADAVLQSQLSAALGANATLMSQNAALTLQVSDLTQRLAKETQEIVDANSELDRLNEQVLEMVGRMSSTRGLPEGTVPVVVVEDESAGEPVSVDTLVIPVVIDAPDVSVVPTVVNVPDISIIPSVVNTPDTAVIPVVVSAPDIAVIPNIIIPVESRTAADTAVLPNILDEPSSLSNEPIDGTKSEESIALAGENTMWSQLKHLLWG